MISLPFAFLFCLVCLAAVLVVAKRAPKSDPVLEWGRRQNAIADACRRREEEDARRGA